MNGGRLRNRLLSLVLLLLAISWTAQAATITCRDKLGRTVSVNTPVKRVVFFITYELIPALDIWERVVGVGIWAYDNDLMRATKPNIANILPSTGCGTDINIEALLKLKPDLVITWTFKPETISFMEKNGLKVIAIYPESLFELYDVMRLHGRLFGKEKRMEYCISEMENIFKIIKERVSRIPDHKRKKVLWLGGKPTTVSCGVGITNDVFKLIRAINPASSIPQGNADVPMERIIAWNPDVVFIWGNASYGVQSILRSPQWRFIRAVKEGRVYKAPQWSTWAPRLALIALWMAMKTYPEYFRDINFERIIDDFYRKVFGIPYRMVEKIEG